MHCHVGKTNDEDNFSPIIIQTVLKIFSCFLHSIFLFPRLSLRLSILSYILFYTSSCVSHDEFIVMIDNPAYLLLVIIIMCNLCAT